MRRASSASSMPASLQELRMSVEPQAPIAERNLGIELSSAQPPVPIPRGHIGEFVIPGTGKLVWWTGRVAIGLRHHPVRCSEPLAESSLWIQKMMLDQPQRLAAHRS
jgi:hypothetical protein